MNSELRRKIDEKLIATLTPGLKLAVREALTNGVPARLIKTAAKIVHSLDPDGWFDPLAVDAYLDRLAQENIVNADIIAIKEVAR